MSDRQSHSLYPLDVVDRAGDCLRSGGLVVVPTDTVYGIAASIEHSESIQRLFRLKRRSSRKSIALLVSSIDSLPQLGVQIGGRENRFLNALWPGQVTVVFPSQRPFPKGVAGPGETVGIRMPDLMLAREIIDRAGGAVACTSANLSNQEPATSIEGLDTVIRENVAMVVDGGQTSGGMASTVVAIDKEAMRLLREGPVSMSDVENFWRKSAH